MRRSLFLSLGVGILGTTLVCGCSQTPRRSSTYVTGRTPRSSPELAAAPTQVAVAPRPTTLVQPQVGAATPSATNVPGFLPPSEETPKLHAVLKADPKATPDLTPAPVRQDLIPPKPTTTPGVAGAPTTPAHAGDFSWIAGVVESGRQPNVWLLRYAPAETNDRFGGCVTLVLEPADARTLYVGRAVRVEGALLDPDAGGSRPGYRVSALRPDARP